jgi:hypothetical protein
MASASARIRCAERTSVRPTTQVMRRKAHCLSSFLPFI